MNTRIILPAVLGAMLLGSPVFAAGTTTPAAPAPQKVATMTQAEQCASLEKKFDLNLKSHERATLVIQAKTLREDGGKLCADGKQADGITKLEQAIKDLGVKS